MPNVFQVAVELNEPLMKNGGRPYRAFLEAVDASNPHVTIIPRVAGEYDQDTHAFYGAGNREDADRFSQKAKATGLVKAVHIDEF
jgi:hypothetical protein